MKRKYFCLPLWMLIIMCCVVSFSAEGQRLVFVYGHGQYNVPQGKLANSYDYGLGVQAGVGVGLGSNFVVGTASFQHFPANNNLSAARLAILKAGYRRTIALKRLFLQVNGGVGSYKVKNDFTRSVYTGDLLVGAKLLGLELTTGYEGFGNTRMNFSGSLVFKAGFNLGL